MGCSNHPSSNDIVQIITSVLFGWLPVPSDNRYKEKYWTRSDGGLGRMTRSANQSPDPREPDYPHFTEIYDKDGHKQNFTRKGGEVTMWDSHYSKIDTDGHKVHEGAHKTAQAVLDDLDAAINSLKSSR